MTHKATRLRAIRLSIPGVTDARDWIAAETARAAELYGADAAIEAIRAASNVMEQSLPLDYASDSRWL